MRRNRSRERNAAVRRGVSSHVLRSGLRAEERSRGVDVESFAPLLVRHRDRGHAAYDSGEAEHVVEGAEGGDRGGDSFGHRGGVGDVDGDAEDADCWELGCEGCDGGEGGAERAFEVPDADAGCAVFEHCAGAGEA